MKRGLQARATRTQQLDRPLDSPYLTSQGAVQYLVLPSLSSLYHHIRQNKLPVLRAGGDLRFDKRELDAWLRNTNALELARATRGNRQHLRLTNPQQERTV